MLFFVVEKMTTTIEQNTKVKAFQFPSRKKAVAAAEEEKHALPFRGYAFHSLIEVVVRSA